MSPCARWLAVTCVDIRGPAPIVNPYNQKETTTMIKTIPIALLGACGALAFVISCSDDAGSRVDAAGEACDCTGFEPSLKDRIVRVTATHELLSGDNSAATARCPDDPETGRSTAIVLGGSCTLDVAISTITLSRSQIEDENVSRAWTCDYWNPTQVDATIITTVICLLPAPTN